MKVYHGTTKQAADNISKHGLWDWKNKQPAWLTSSLNEAVFFATLCASAEEGGSPSVVEVEIPKDSIIAAGPLGMFTKKVIATSMITNVHNLPANARSSMKKSAMFYPGWMGIMETAKFMQTASEEDISRFMKLVDEDKINEAWNMVESVLRLPHHEYVPARASLNLFAAVSRFADPLAHGLAEYEMLTTSLGVAASHPGYKIVSVKVPADLVEGVSSDGGDVDNEFFMPKSAISPLFVTAVYNPWKHKSFKVSAFDVSFNLDDLLSVVTDQDELKVFQALVHDGGSVHPKHIPAFIKRATPYLVSLLRESKSSYTPDHLFGLIKKGTMIQDSCGNYSINHVGSEMANTLQLSIGDIVKDINTSTEGEVVAISKMHHEADIDIVVKWNQPINGQSVFEVHPNEIEFIRHKTDDEILKDVDYRYYEETALASKGLKTRLDYGSKKAGRFYSIDDFKIVWDEYKTGLGLYRAIGEMKESGGQTLFWAADNDGPNGGIQIVDPEEIQDGFIDFRTSLQGQYADADEMIADAENIISEVAYAGFKRAKAAAPAGAGEAIGETKEAPAKEEKGRGAEGEPPVPAGLPTRSQPDLNGYILNDDGSKCIPFQQAFAVHITTERKWQIYIIYRDPTLKDLGDEYLEVEDYLNRRLLCAEKPE